MAKAVCDAGPLIHLAEVQQEPLLGQFSPLIIPSSVLREAISFKAPSTLRFDVQNPSSDQRLRVIAMLGTALDSGEVDALTICLSSPGAIFLSDDLKARREGERLGLPVHGSLGIVVRAFRFGLLTRDQAKGALLNLGNCRSLFVSKAVVDVALDALNRMPDQ